MEHRKENEGEAGTPATDTDNSYKTPASMASRLADDEVGSYPHERSSSESVILKCRGRNVECENIILNVDTVDRRRNDSRKLHNDILGWRTTKK